MKIRSLTFLATLFVSHTTLANLPTLNNITDPCNNIEGKWSGGGDGQCDQVPQIACHFEGYIIVKKTGPGTFTVTDNMIDKKSGSIVCVPHIILANTKGTCSQGILHIDGETVNKDGSKTGTKMILDGSLQSDTSATLHGSMDPIGGTNYTAHFKEFKLTKQQ